MDIRDILPKQNNITINFVFKNWNKAHNQIVANVKNNKPMLEFVDIAFYNILVKYGYNYNYTVEGLLKTNKDYTLNVKIVLDNEFNAKYTQCYLKHTFENYNIYVSETNIYIVIDSYIILGLNDYSKIKPFVDYYNNINKSLNFQYIQNNRQIAI
jgi:hypothetical protein